MNDSTASTSNNCTTTATMDLNVTPTMMNTSTAALSAKLSSLRSKSSQLSAELLSKLTTTSSSSSSSSSSSGQNSSSASLLHMASTLSSILPPQLQQLDTVLLRPLHAEMEEYLSLLKKDWEYLLHSEKELQEVIHKSHDIDICQSLYDDLQIVLSLLRYADDEKGKGQEGKEMEEEKGKDMRDHEKVYTKRSPVNFMQDTQESTNNYSSQHVFFQNFIFTSTFDEFVHEIATFERASYLIYSLLEQVQRVSNPMNTSTSTTTNSSTTTSSSSSHANTTTTKGIMSRTEKSHFILRLAPQIRSCKEKLCQLLLLRLEKLFIMTLTHSEDVPTHQPPYDPTHHDHDECKVDPTIQKEQNQTKHRKKIPISLLLSYGHIFRSLSLFEEIPAAERCFVKIVTMPTIRSFLVSNAPTSIGGTSFKAVSQSTTGSSTISTSNVAENTNIPVSTMTTTSLMLNRLDEGGIRGECTGLQSLLQDILYSIQYQWGDLFVYLEDMFYHLPARKSVHPTTESIHDVNSSRQTRRIQTIPVVDLLTNGIWVPIATTLTAEPNIKMAIFSPGIANVFQANYVTLDEFISNLAVRLLSPSSTKGDSSLTSFIDGNNTSSKQDDELDTNVDRNTCQDEDILVFEELYYRPTDLDGRSVRRAQKRIDQHHVTTDFYKKWTLPIYYQLRFAEVCTRMNNALDRVQVEGWHAFVFTGTSPMYDSQEDWSKYWRDTIGLDLPIFWEMYDALLWMWKPNVYLNPLTHRFVRGIVQLIGRFISFISDGLEGKIRFGQSQENMLQDVNSATETQIATEDATQLLPSTVDTTYNWGERMEDVASVSWNLSVLLSYIQNDYLILIRNSIIDASHQNDDNLSSTLDETCALCNEIFSELSQDFKSIITKSWEGVIVNSLVKKCSVPLSAVKGVAATFRMTNRPAPTLPSPFVATILRPLKEFDAEFTSKTPREVGDVWKKEVIGSIASKYSTAVSELIETVQRTEEALKNRKARKTATSGMSDGEKVKLQLYLDSKSFEKYIEELAVEPSSIHGIQVLRSITQEGEALVTTS